MKNDKNNGDKRSDDNLDTYTTNVAGRRLIFHHHQREHFEEILAKWLIIMHADRNFVDKYFPDGNAYLGAGESIFNEHPQNGKPRKKGDCCATLVAKALGVDKKPELQILLNNAYFSDTHDRRSRGKHPKPEEKHHPLEPARLVNSLHETYPDKPALVAKMVTDAFIKPNIREQTEFFGNKTVFKKQGRLEEIPWVNSSVLKVLVVETDNPQMHNYAFHCHMDIAVIKRSTGHVHLFTSAKIKERHGQEMDLREVAMMIRLDEEKRAGRTVEKGWHELQDRKSVV